MAFLEKSFNIPKRFTPSIKTTVKWFPGHMNIGLKKMQARLRNIDCVIEVHDSRIPFSGRNPNFKEILTALKPHILLLNKADLCQHQHKKEVEKIIMDQGISSIIHTNCKDQTCPGIKKILPLVNKLIQSSERYHRSEAREYSLMVIGIPNVGKSSVINILRNRNMLIKGNAARVGAIAGITRNVQERIKVCEDPLIYLLDTPGILEPNVRSYEIGMKLALCSNFPDHLIGEDAMCDYLLYHLNKTNNFSYVKYLGLDEPCNDIQTLLMKAAVKRNSLIKVKDFSTGSLRIKPDLMSVAKYFVQGFRQGHFGPMFLDSEYLKDCL